MWLYIFFVLIPSVLCVNKACPGGTSACPDSATCCQLADMSYGCCPLENAVCCDDHIHCCAAHLKCEAGLCIQVDGINVTATRLNKVTCDSKSSCPDDNTCCKGSLPDTYSCCPLPDAVCCDPFHCCPQNTVCDLKQQMCVSKEGYVSRMYGSKKNGILKFGGRNITAMGLDKKVACDSKFSCPDDSTCCKGPSPGSYSCCPLPDAVCCDFLHCCPQNTVCDLEKQMCVRKEGSVSKIYNSKTDGIFKFGSSRYLTLLKPSSLNNVFCPDYFQCPDGYTCCQLPNSDWGCCPFPKATCCADKLHCCPHNMKCDPTSQACSQGHVSIPSLQKEIAKPFVGDIICPDNSTCADSSTCCQISSGRFGCCPYENAVCCKDLSHCCPSDFTCDIVAKQCVPNKSRLPNI